MIDPPTTTLSPPQDSPSNQELEIDSGSYVFRDEAILGTRLRIDLVARNFSDAQAAALNARGEIDRLNAILNTRDPDSEISILNRSRTYRASPELFAVVEMAERWRTATAGAFSGRLGQPIALWANARDNAPPRDELTRLARVADAAEIGLDRSTRTIARPDEVRFALDALAKGWIVDRAFDIARNSPGVVGALVDIGGDTRCGGRAPDANGWRIGIPDARIPADNAPLVATTYLSNHAIATSGRGPRDRIIGGVQYSPTLSPRDGWPVQHAVSVTAVATSAADADAMATALLAMPHREAVAWANRNDVTARIQTDDHVAVTHSTVSPIRLAEAKPSRTRSKGKASAGWPKDWVALIVFTAPPRQLVRDQHFRAPYMAMWISDLDNKPIRTLLLVGRDLDWQKDNYIWWSLNGANVKHLSATRSMSTSGAGVYKMQWDGTDDEYKEVPAGKYVLHVETSRERGKHTHRSLTLDFLPDQPFTDQIPTSEEAGGVTIDFHRF